MLYLNFSNVEELIFWNTDIQKLFPEHMFSLFEQWRLAQLHPFLRELGKQAILDFLNSLTDEDIDVLEEYLGEKIVVERLNYNIAINIKMPISKACEKLCEVEGFNYFSTWRDDEHLYLSCWK